MLVLIGWIYASVTTTDASVTFMDDEQKQEEELRWIQSAIHGFMHCNKCERQNLMPFIWLNGMLITLNTFAFLFVIALCNVICAFMLLEVKEMTSFVIFAWKSLHRNIIILW